MIDQKYRKIKKNAKVQKKYRKNSYISIENVLALRQ